MSVGVAHADIVHQNDLQADPAEHTVEVGQIDVTSYWITQEPANQDDQNGCNASDERSAVVTIHAPAAVTVSPSAITFTACSNGINNKKTVNLSSNVAGSYLITATVADSGVGKYDVSGASFTLNVVKPADKTPPVITAPDITVEATGPTTPVSFSATAVDAVDGPRPVSYSDNGPFTVGVHTVIASATDLSNNTATKSFTVTVTEPPAPVDGTPPVIDVPDDMTVEATGPNGAAANFSVSAEDNIDESVSVSCDPDSGSTFPLGESTVNCSATDAAGNQANASFKVNVVDTKAPELPDLSDIDSVEATGPNGAVVNFGPATAHDTVDGDVPVYFTPVPGSVFALGSSTVLYSATDKHGNTASKSFSVKVVDTTPPEIAVPDDITKEATGPNTPVSFTATAHDLVNGDVEVTYNDNGPFAVGEHIIVVTAKDSRDNEATKSFKVTITDTTKPELSQLPDITKDATSAAGVVVNYDPATATDLVDGPVSVTYSKPSGSTFPLGETVVTYSATDAHGNKAEKSFKAKVLVAWAGLNQPINRDGSSVFKLGSTVPLKFNSFPGLNATLTWTKIDNSPDGNVVEEVNSNPASTGNLFRYDPAAGQYMYNLGTKNLSAGDWLLHVNLGDGVDHSTKISLRK
jgi:hypothetical protein